MNINDYNRLKLSSKKPEKLVKLAFIHHSCGEAWLDDNDGGLGKALLENNYFVSTTDYGWGPGRIGSSTDAGHWWGWFRSENSPGYTDALYSLNDKNCEYTRQETIPAGENEVIMFKSCYPNSEVKGDIHDTIPDISGNPLKNENCSSDYHTVGNIKSIFLDILKYFETRQDKLFILVTPPPVQDGTWAFNARTLNNWLAYEWLKDYPYENVAIFDLYNVLTSNGGAADVDDTGSMNGNHHRFIDGNIQHAVDQDMNSNTLKYPDKPDDDHPNRTGNLKATAEYIELLNVYYNVWKDI